ncbi:hypothetical protein D3C72_2213510 [compost metagenome]
MIVEDPLLLINSSSKITDCPVEIVRPTLLLIVNFFAENDGGEFISPAIIAGLVIVGPFTLFHDEPSQVTVLVFFNSRLK